ncbi:hypothetical protein FKP32DRAFT_1587113 [Trametes sanguinea]|nr:hypothetical protein FKP32DRAFT_1587113 [Trametes sanguinea]
MRLHSNRGPLLPPPPPSLPLVPVFHQSPQLTIAANASLPPSSPSSLSSCPFDTSHTSYQLSAVPSSRRELGGLVVEDISAFRRCGRMTRYSSIVAPEIQIARPGRSFVPSRPAGRHALSLATQCTFTGASLSLAQSPTTPFRPHPAHRVGALMPRPAQPLAVQHGQGHRRARLSGSAWGI